jgi:hypothetical protein
MGHRPHRLPLHAHAKGEDMSKIDECNTLGVKCLLSALERKDIRATKAIVTALLTLPESKEHP